MYIFFPLNSAKYLYFSSKMDQALFVTIWGRCNLRMNWHFSAQFQSKTHLNTINKY